MESARTRRRLFLLRAAEVTHNMILHNYQPGDRLKSKKYKHGPRKIIVVRRLRRRWGVEEVTAVGVGIIYFRKDVYWAPPL